MWLKREQIEFKAKKIDIPAINERLDKLGVRANSPQMVHLITDEYDMHGNYTQLISPSEIVAVGPDDSLHVLNRFYYGIHAAYSAKWECVADSSIDKKAKDVKKTLSKAVSQIPPHGEGIIHIGYETVMGPAVEFKRHEKTIDTVSNFNFSEKSIEAVYCHAIQPLCKIGEWECAETTIFFEKHPRKLFSERLLLDPQETIVRNSTHWMEDVFGKK